ncbi:MAG: hypothetical protein RL386_19 [Bacteroidota bacterium]
MRLLSHNLLPPAAAEDYIETALVTLILLRKINETSAVSNYYLTRSAEKSLLPPAEAEDYFETDVFFMILRSKIMKNTSVSNINVARSTEKRLIGQHQIIF